MKKLIMLILATMLLISLCACGDDDTEVDISTSAPETTVESFATISTPYAELKLRESIADNVKYDIAKEDPYTLKFSKETLSTAFGVSKGAVALIFNTPECSRPSVQAISCGP